MQQLRFALSFKDDFRLLMCHFRKIVASKIGIQESEKTEMLRAVIPAAKANGDQPLEVDPPSSSISTYNSDELITLETANKTASIPESDSFEHKRPVSGGDSPPLVIAYDSDDL